jgi:hypothetical protein
MIYTMTSIRLPSGDTVPLGRFVVEIGVFGSVIELPLTGIPSVMSGLYEAAARMGAELDVEDPGRILGWFVKAWLDPGPPSDIRLIAGARVRAFERITLPDRWDRGIVPESWSLGHPIDETVGRLRLKQRLTPAERERLLGDEALGPFEGPDGIDRLTAGVRRVLEMARVLKRIGGVVSGVFSPDGPRARGKAKPRAPRAPRAGSAG